MAFRTAEPEAPFVCKPMEPSFAYTPTEAAMIYQEGEAQSVSKPTEATIIYQEVEAPTGYKAVEAKIFYHLIGRAPAKVKIFYNGYKAAEVMVISKTGAAIGHEEAGAKGIGSVMKIMTKIEAGEDLQAELASGIVEFLNKDQIAKILVMPWPPKVARATPEHDLNKLRKVRPELAEMLRLGEAEAVESHKLHVVEWCVIRDRFRHGRIPEDGMVIVREGGL